MYELTFRFSNQQNKRGQIVKTKHFNLKIIVYYNILKLVKLLKTDFQL